MRWSYLAKLVLKSVLVLIVVTLVAFSLVDNHVPAQFTGITTTGSKHGIVERRSSGAKINDDNNAPYFDNTAEGGEDNAKYHLRFWDLVNSTKNAGHVLSTQPLFHDKVDYLWRPKKGQKEITPEWNTLVSQNVWAMEAPNSSHAKSFKTKTILLWDDFKWWHKDNWNDPKQLISTDCEIAPNSLTQCRFTQNKRDLNKSVDAVIAARDMFHTGPVHVPEHVLKFYFILESPFHSWAYLNRSQDLLATYWRGSDILTPYSKWVYYDMNNKAIKQEKNYAQGKTKTAAAFISNCAAWNDRNGYITQLQKYIHVDVYGSCGTLRCSRFGNEDCFGMLKRDYHFYMSFENSNCRDYITEKLFTNGLSNDVVPIVMGAHPEDYSALAPHKSYISIEDFDSPKALAKYLHFLIANPTEYNKYFEWKGTGEFISAAFFCQICAMVHYADIEPPPKRTKPYRWGHVQAINSGMCLPKGEWYWTKDNKGIAKRKEKRNSHINLNSKENADNIQVEDVVEDLGVNALYDTES